MEYILVIAVLIIVLLLVYSYLSLMRTAGEHLKLTRAIAVLDKEINLVDKANEIEESGKKSPFDKGIDPYDVYSTLSIARMKGNESLTKEKKQYGNIREL